MYHTLTYTNFGRYKVWRRNLDYTKILQVKYFTTENIPTYGSPTGFEEVGGWEGDGGVIRNALIPTENL